MVTHTQRTSRRFDTHASTTENTVVTLFNQLVTIHLGWRCDPQTGIQLAIEFFKQFTRRAEVPDVGHTRADEHFIDGFTRTLRKQTSIVWIVWRT
ncbi:Uncharacterised protein [Vibrio cholerae]|uniref:Uncharacterized protein n=1 Tax=Vibrio cholerae TaxID=666 RepID=A0A655QT02_VIBCL|nr:Uncharacterised protein [Vibrio cholerae]CSA73129.1 Uncharacterised protein [Vibrio cholerae]CSC67034.1 Uncharacterised protein [Vibrio cholerae]